MNTLERINRKIIKDEGSECWLWQGFKVKGYGRIRIDGKAKRVHRLMYEQMVGPIPDGLVIDHLCMVRNCVNPEHLEPVTIEENTRRSNKAKRLK